MRWLLCALLVGLVVVSCKAPSGGGAGGSTEPFGDRRDRAKRASDIQRWVGHRHGLVRQVGSDTFACGP
jgi:hypothetical protein